MITFFGIIIFIIPFIFVRIFRDKTIGFLTIFTASLLTHLIVALVTQSFKIFNYQTILSVYTAIDAVVLIIYYLKFRRAGFPEKHILAKSNDVTSKIKDGIQKSLLLKILTFIAFAVVFFNLLSVHFNFSGTINTQVGEYHVDKSVYEYPYFSDEWVAISFVNYAIKSQSLPIVNPLSGSGEFKSPLTPYFSFLSDIFLFFGLSPLNDFTTLTLLVGFAICILFFILLSSLGIDKRVSLITVLTIPYITNGGNLPGIWFLIPMVFSLVFYLISLIAFAKKDNKLLFISSLMCLSLYPPFIAFVFPTLVVLVLRKKEWHWKDILIALSSIFLAFAIVGSILLNNVNPIYILEVLRFYFFRSNLVGGILSFPIWNVLPVFVLPIAVFGFWPAFKNKLYFLISPLLVGLLYWLCYIDTDKVFIIDFPRVVVITSFLILILFALSLNYLFDKFINWDKVKTKWGNEGVVSQNIFSLITIICILMAVIFSINYTENDSWRGLKLKLNMNNKNELSFPAPTASRFLTEDDLRLFSGITSKTFISPPWKGLVISAATGNYPLATKPSTVGVFTLNYNVFVVDSDCKEKERLAIENKIDYVYSEKFQCPNFKEVGESHENLTLYRFDKK